MNLSCLWLLRGARCNLSGLQHFQVITDHHPLIPILNSHRLDEVENPRLQCLKSLLMGYNFTATWVKGKMNDVLSRSPLLDPQTQEALAEYDEGSNPAMSIHEIRTVATESPRVLDLCKQANGDEEYKLLRDTIFNGFPEHHSQMPEPCRPYWNVRPGRNITFQLGVVILSGQSNIDQTCVTKGWSIFKQLNCLFNNFRAQYE